MDLHLKDKVFFIAGSSQGIGLGIARALLREGAKVVITGRNENKLDAAYDELANKFTPDKVIALPGDLLDWDIINLNFDKTINKFGKIDGLIANIGEGKEPLLTDEDPDFWQAIYDKNFKASLNQAQAAIKFLKGDGGVIIFISSIAGVEDMVSPIAYSSFKAALNMAAKKLARKLATDNIRVNVIAPGNIHFDGGVWDKKLSENKAKTMEYIKSAVPMQRFGEIEDVGCLCAFLCSARSKFITGSTIVIDGGQTHRL